MIANADTQQVHESMWSSIKIIVPAYPWSAAGTPQSSKGQTKAESSSTEQTKDELRA